MESIWSKAKALLRERMDPAHFHRWIEPIQCLDHSNGEIHLGCPNSFFRDWVGKHHLRTLQEALVEVVGGEVTFWLEVDPQGMQEGQERVSSRGQLPFPNLNLPARWTPRLNPRFTFDRFVVGPCNEFAYNAAVLFAKENASRYNPLCLYADIGLGKSHLSCAIGNFILQHFQGERIHYLTAEEFLNEMVLSLKNKRHELFKEKFRKNCDVLVLDGVQFLSGKEKTQAELTQTLEVLCNGGKRVVLTSSVIPKDLPSMEEGLKSRLTSGLMVDIQPPDPITRRKILLEKAAQEGIALPEPVLDYLAQRVEGRVRKLESVLINLMAKASLMNCPIEIDLAKEVVRCIVSTEEQKASIEGIQRMVCRFFQLTPEQLQSRSRKRSVVYPRQIAMYLCRNHTESSLETIGKAFNRDHASVIHSIAVIAKGVQEKAQVRHHIEYLTERLNE